MTAGGSAKVRTGQRVLVQVYNNRTRHVETRTGTCEGIVPALDRPYRIDVRSDEPGIYWRGCAPECVEAA